MYDLGHTCSTSRREYLLHTPGRLRPHAVSGLTGGMAVVHISPAGGSAFLHASIELDPGGVLRESNLPDVQRFVYVVSGAVDLNADATIRAPRSRRLRLSSTGHASHLHRHRGNGLSTHRKALHCPRRHRTRPSSLSAAKTALSRSPQ